MVEPNKATSYNKTFWKQHRLLVITSGVLIFMAIVLGVLPLVLQRTFTNFLIECGAKNVSIDDVDFNISSSAWVMGT